MLALNTVRHQSGSSRFSANPILRLCGNHDFFRGTTCNDGVLLFFVVWSWTELKAEVMLELQ